MAITAIAVMTMSVAAEAQEHSAFGIRAGFNLSNVILKDSEGEKADTDGKPGFQLGVAREFWYDDKPFGGNMGVIFSTQGYQVKDKDSDAKMSLNLNYLKIPINFKYHFDMGDVKVFAQAGAYLGFGLFGKIKMWDDTGKSLKPEDIGETKDDWKIKFGVDEEKADLMMLDVGVGAGAGIQYRNMIVDFRYDVGLLNNYLGDSGKAKMKNKGLGITLTYLFMK